MKKKKPKITIEELLYRSGRWDAAKTFPWSKKYIKDDKCNAIYVLKDDGSLEILKTQ